MLEFRWVVCWDVARYRGEAPLNVPGRRGQHASPPDRLRTALGSGLAYRLTTFRAIYRVCQLPGPQLFTCPRPNGVFYQLPGPVDLPARRLNVTESQLDRSDFQSIMGSYEGASSAEPAAGDHPRGGW
jgi:hypothetical protein